MSLLESELMKKGKGQTDLSEMFIARYSMVRKIQRHLKLKGGNFFTPGGQFHDAVWVMKNFGLVPEEIYSGKGRGEFYHNHAEMDTLLSHFVQECVKTGTTELSNEQRQWIDSVLDHYYGTVPENFIYKGKSIFKTHHIWTETEEFWEPTLLKLSDDAYLTVAFVPDPDAKKEQGHYILGSGHFNLIKLNVKTGETSIIEEQVFRYPFAPTPPNDKYILIEECPHEIVAMSKDLSKRIQAVKKSDLLTDEESLCFLKWSPDSKFFTMSTWNSSRTPLGKTFGTTLYKVDVP